MYEYRLYPLDRNNRITGAGIEIVCVSDQAALRIARARIGTASAIEVWSRARRVGRIEGVKAAIEP